MLVMLLWLLLFAIVVLWLAYARASLVVATIALGALLVGYTVLGGGSIAWKAVLWALFIPHVLLNVRPLRRVLVSNRFLLVFKRMLPPMSTTEREALEAGTVWWDGELFTGRTRLVEAPLGEAARAARRMSRPSSTGPAKSSAG